MLKEAEDELTKQLKAIPDGNEVNWKKQFMNNKYFNRFTAKNLVFHFEC